MSGVPTRSELIADAKRNEQVGVEVQSEDLVYFTDERPERHGQPEERFILTPADRRVRHQFGDPAVAPRYFRRKTVVVIEREEITEEEYLRAHPDPSWVRKV